MTASGKPEGVADKATGRLTVVETYDAFFRREYRRLVTLARTLSGSG